jgi:SAM-dependent methyltransferase|tara:strand:- start:923 stop:1666 length:744 start_codon:yes stop_codon:yes gene_type:complete
MIKKIIKLFIPNFLLKAKATYIAKLYNRKFIGMSDKEIFKKIYTQNLWGKSVKVEEKYYSGLGSHSNDLTGKYIKAVNSFLMSLSKKPNVVDLGCGDFNIGRKLRRYCADYIAIDIFDELIKFNKKTFFNLKVDFRALDVTQEEVPAADICFVRQVLQHISNDSIFSFLKNIKNKYTYLIVTEHYPTSKFIPNLDKNTGPGIRFYDNSAVVLHKKPYRLKYKFKKTLCKTSTPNMSGYLKTIVYKLD